MKKHLLFCIWLLFFSSYHSFAGNTLIDSLQSVLKDAKEDTVKAFLLTELSWERLVTGDFRSALQNADSALALSKKLNYRWGIATAYNRKAGALEEFGNYAEALKNYEASLKINIETGNKKGIASNTAEIVFLLFIYFSCKILTL